MQSLKLIALAYNFLKSSDKIVIVNDADKLYLNIKEKFDIMFFDYPFYFKTVLTLGR